MRPQDKAPGGARPTGGTCPICKSSTEHKYRPFCSKRCADVDLNRWLNDSYRIPGPPIGLDDEEGDER